MKFDTNSFVEVSIVVAVLGIGLPHRVKTERGAG
jgi:hypothetical protein